MSSIKLIFEYEGEDQEKMVDELSQYILTELMPKYNAEENGQHAFIVAFGGEPSDWVRLKAHMLSHKPQGGGEVEAVSSSSEGWEQVQEQIKNRRKRRGEPTNDDKTEGSSGLGSFLDKI